MDSVAPIPLIVVERDSETESDFEDSSETDAEVDCDEDSVAVADVASLLNELEFVAL